MRFKKTLKIALLITSAIVALSIIASLVFAAFYEKTALRYIRNYLDDHLVTQISLEDFRFRILKGFPNATIEISNVVILSGRNFSASDFAGSFADTLLKADKVLLQFDLFRLVRKQFHLKKLVISKGFINLLYDNRNRNNLNIWTKPDTPSVPAVIKLQSIELAEMHMYFASLKEKFNLSFTADKITARGTLNGVDFSGNIKGRSIINELSFNNSSAFRQIPLQLEIKAEYSNKRFLIPEGKAVVGKIPFSFAGEFSGGKTPLMHLNFDASKFDFSDVITLFPEFGKRIPASINVAGTGKIKGTINRNTKRKLDISAGFFIMNGKIRNSKTKSDITQINGNGHVSGSFPDNLILELENFSSKMGKGTIEGKFILSDFQRPYLQGNISSVLDLETLVEFSGIDTIEFARGNVKSDFYINGHLQKNLDSAAVFLNLLENGNLIFRDVGLKFKDSPWEIDNLTGKAAWNQKMVMDSIAFKFNKTSFLVSGTADNISSYLSHTGILLADLKISTDYLNINNLLSGFAHDKPAKGRKENIVFPSGIQLKSVLSANRFEAGKFIAGNVEMNLLARKDSLFIKEFSLQFPDGTITGNALILGVPGEGIAITCNSASRHINIQQLFTSFNNFTQQFIIDKNVKGKLDGTINFYAIWDSTLKFMPASMKAQADISISNGELIQFDPMLRLSKYIDVDELRHIRFKTLENVIHIDDRKVIIPEMAIHSTAFNIAVSGTHHFDNQFDYRMKVLLSEVLFNKARKKRNEIDEFIMEENEKDKTTIPLIISGTPDNYEVKFDRKKAFDLTRNNLKENNNDKSDTTGNRNFIIEWENQSPGKYNKPSDQQDSGTEFKVEWDD